MSHLILRAAPGSSFYIDVLQSRHDPNKLEIRTEPNSLIVQAHSSNVVYIGVSSDPG